MDCIEPLDPLRWFAALGELAEGPPATDSLTLERRLRRAYYLLQLTPRPLRHVIRTDLAEDRFEALLICEAFDAAAIGLAGTPMRFRVSKAEAGMIEAEVWLPDHAEPSTARSLIPGAALLEAWLRCLVELSERAEVLSAEPLARARSHLRLVVH